MDATKPVTLIADDEADSLNLLTDILSAEGYEVRASDSGESALASAATHPPDLILLDLRTPGMDGLEVCRRLKESEPTRETPLMFISGAADVEQRCRGSGHGSGRFRHQAVPPEELVGPVSAPIWSWAVSAPTWKESRCTVPPSCGRARPTGVGSRVGRPGLLRSRLRQWHRPPRRPDTRDHRFPTRTGTATLMACSSGWNTCIQTTVRA